MNRTRQTLRIIDKCLQSLSLWSIPETIVINSAYLGINPSANASILDPLLKTNRAVRLKQMVPSLINAMTLHANKAILHIIHSADSVPPARAFSVRSPAGDNCPVHCHTIAFGKIELHIFSRIRHPRGHLSTHIDLLDAIVGSNQGSSKYRPHKKYAMIAVHRIRFRRTRLNIDLCALAVINYLSLTESFERWAAGEIICKSGARAVPNSKRT